jgi:hypothetical protein
MTDHGGRAHATWSASATSRNWNCSGALALGAKVDKLDVESEAAAWGTACHSIAEKALDAKHIAVDSAHDLIGHPETTKSHTFIVDEEMAGCAQEYVDYVRGRLAQYKAGTGQDAILFIEERFSLAKLDPPFDAGGTCDAIMFFPLWQEIEVVDLKGGRGVVVEVTENKQLRTYALGALLAHPELDVVKVKSTIVQPRAPHKDGRIRSETYHVSDLMEWTHELMERMHVAKEAENRLLNVKGELMREVWGQTYLRAGDHCTFCPAAAICPALESKALAVADAFFNDSGAVVVRNQPDELDPARIAQVLDGADALGNWLNAVRALATRMAETGTEIPGYHLADRIGHRKFKDDVTAELTLLALGLTDDNIYAEPEMRSPAQMEKQLGGVKAKREVVEIAGDKRTREQWFNSLVEKPITGRSLVSSAKSTRPAVKPKVEAWFS